MPRLRGFGRTEEVQVLGEQLARHYMSRLSAELRSVPLTRAAIAGSLFRSRIGRVGPG